MKEYTQGGKWKERGHYLERRWEKKNLSGRKTRRERCGLALLRRGGCSGVKREDSSSSDRRRGGGRRTKKKKKSWLLPTFPPLLHPQRPSTGLDTTVCSFFYFHRLPLVAVCVGYVDRHRMCVCIYFTHFFIALPVINEVISRPVIFVTPFFLVFFCFFYLFLFDF